MITLAKAGAFDDRIKLELAGGEIFTSEHFEVKVGVLTQPAAFGINLGVRDGAGKLRKKYPKGTPFRVSVNDCIQAEGKIDACQLRRTTSGTAVAFRGRDIMSDLLESDVDSEVSYEGKTIEQLVETALKEAGVDYTSIAVNAAAARRTRSGANTLVFKEPTYNPKAIKRLARGKVNESWYHFLRRHLDHAGLMIWAGPGKQIIVSRPNANQPPTYRLWVRGNESRPRVIDTNLDDGSEGRYARVRIFSRSGGGRRGGRKVHLGEAVDQEMVGLGFKNLKTIRDVEVGDPEEANFYARRKIAEFARQAFKFDYTVAGLGADLVQGGRGLWTPDTMLDLDDADYELRGKFWIESVAFSSPPTTTRFVLLRPEYLTFGVD